MKTGFKDRCEVPPSKKSPKEPPNPFDFGSMCYDQRTSNFISAGTDYGVGQAQPIGKFHASNKGGVPMGRVDTLKTDWMNKKGHTNIIEMPEPD